MREINISYFSLIVSWYWTPLTRFTLILCFLAMHDASRRLQDCLADMYEPEWFGKEEVNALAEVRPRNVLMMQFFSTCLLPDFK